MTRVLEAICKKDDGGIRIRITASAFRGVGTVSCRLSDACERILLNNQAVFGPREIWIDHHRRLIKEAASVRLLSLYFQSESFIRFCRRYKPTAVPFTGGCATEISSTSLLVVCNQPYLNLSLRCSYTPVHHEK